MDKKDGLIRNYLSKARTKQDLLKNWWLNKIKKQGISHYGKIWQKKTDEWYVDLQKARPLLHQNFINYLKLKKDVQTVLEVGCGAGLYPIKFKELFTGMRYTGLDISKAGIEYCKKNSSFNFICGDILKMNLQEKYDLVFSHAVIDHVYDINGFLSKISQVCKKYAFISAYRGYFPVLQKHKMNWNDTEACFYNDLSVNQLKKTLFEIGLKENEFIVRPQESGQQNLEIETVIEINKI